MDWHLLIPLWVGFFTGSFVREFKLPWWGNFIAGFLAWAVSHILVWMFGV